LHVSASIVTAASPAMLAEFPFPFRLTVTYTLAEAGLALAAEVTNLGEGPLPFGLGIHPYFPLPLSKGSRAEEHTVHANLGQLARMPADLSSVGFVEPERVLDLRRGPSVAEILQASPKPAGASLYVLYGEENALGTGGSGKGAGVKWSLREAQGRARVSVEADGDFRVLLLYAPAEPTVISPVIATCLPNAFNLAAAGYPAGLIELEPGTTWRGRARIAFYLGAENAQ
ncbi:MAG: hypothetical protein M0Z94_00020, partial [Dehalococcoidales bacterium]|nr:hypothetical protein [Dehalococcoidales bacterium]